MSTLEQAKARVERAEKLLRSARESGDDRLGGFLLELGRANWALEKLTRPVVVVAAKAQAPRKPSRGEQIRQAKRLKPMAGGTAITSPEQGLRASGHAWSILAGMSATELARRLAWMLKILDREVNLDEFDRLEAVAARVATALALIEGRRLATCAVAGRLAPTDAHPSERGTDV